MASIWKLPVLFVCENNQFATEVPFSYAAGNPERRRAGRRATACPASRSTATTSWPSPTAARRGRARAPPGGGPTLLECKTYRTRPHAEGMGDFTYRTREEVEQWKMRCPILRLRQRAPRAKLAGEAELAAIDDEIEARVEDAHQYAEASPWPDPRRRPRRMSTPSPHAAHPTPRASEPARANSRS